VTARLTAFVALFVVTPAYLSLAVSRLKLLTFWIRHQTRTKREVGVTTNPLMRTKLATLNLLREQKRLEDGWAANNKEPEYTTTIALDLASAAKAFEKVKTILTRVGGYSGSSPGLRNSAPVTPRR
jgi:hypothetical protein